MGKKRLIVYSFPLFIFQALSAQNSDSLLLPILELDLPIVDFAIDPIHQLYIISPKNELNQYRLDGSQPFNFNNHRSGDIGFVDASNPLNILVYYPDFQVVILLDRTLNEQYRYDLLDYNVPGTQVVAMSRNQSIWLYDRFDFQLKQLNKNGKISATSLPLNQLLNELPNPVQLVAEGNWVYMNDPESGLFIFDQFGQFHKVVPIIGIKHFSVEEDIIFASMVGNANDLMQIRWLQSRQVEIEGGQTLYAAEKVIFTSNYVYAKFEQRIVVYRFKQKK